MGRATDVNGKVWSALYLDFSTSHEPLVGTYTHTLLTVFVVGGSTGLGKEISKVLAAQGAHRTIFARKQAFLDEAKDEITSSRASESQIVKAVAADMSNAVTVRSVLAAQIVSPDILYCVAGGTAHEFGFLADTEPEAFARCMNNNYYASLYPTKVILQNWIEDDETAAILKIPRPRQILFVNSSASLTPAPGYLAYNAAKAAQRALADTLRLEVQRYSGPKSEYSVQCVFAHNLISPIFIEERKHKPELTKRLEGTYEATNCDKAHMLFLKISLKRLNSKIVF